MHNHSGLKQMNESSTSGAGYTGPIPPLLNTQPNRLGAHQRGGCLGRIRKMPRTFWGSFVVSLVAQLVLFVIFLHFYAPGQQQLNGFMNFYVYLYLPAFAAVGLVMQSLDGPASLLVMMLAPVAPLVASVVYSLAISLTVLFVTSMVQAAWQKLSGP